MSELRLVTSKTLLYMFLDLHYRNPDFTKWTEERASDYPPFLFRLKQLMSVFKAYQLPWDPQLFADGHFIDPKNPNYTDLSRRLIKMLRRNFREQYDSYQLTECFRILMNYRLQLNKVLTYSGGVLEASGLYLLAYIKVEELNKKIQMHVKIVDEILASLISPESLSFSIEELVLKFDFPDVDLREIDFDSM